MDQVRNYHAPVENTMAAGHPEIEFPGVEVTTGPLGQGIANAVGLAVAGKQLGAQYNKDGFPIVDGKIWAMTGDGCIQEGVGMEGEFYVASCAVGPRQPTPAPTVMTFADHAQLSLWPVTGVSTT